MKAWYATENDQTSTQSARLRTTSVNTPTDVVGMLAGFRKSSTDPELQWLPALLLGDYDMPSLTVAPVGSGVVLVYATPNSATSQSAVNPDYAGPEDATVWYMYMGSASEMEADRVIPQELAMEAVAQFLADPDTLPQVDGFVWEQD